MNVKTILLSLTAVFLLVILYNFIAAWHFPDTSWPLEKGEKTKLDSEIIQKFEADRDGLSKIKILFGDSDVSPGGTFSLKVFDESCQEPVRSAKLDIRELNSDTTVDFVFPRIESSKGKVYCLKLSYSQKKGGKKANIFVIGNTMKQNKYFSINGQEMAGQSVSMRPAYKKASLFEDAGELNERISQYKPWFLKHYFLWFISIGFILLSIGLVTILILL